MKTPVALLAALLVCWTAAATLIQEDFEGCVVGPHAPSDWREVYTGPGCAWEIVDTGVNQALKLTSGPPSGGGGFASLDAGASAGTVTTRPVRFSGSRLFVNADCPHGELRAEILDEAGDAVEPFTLADCVPISSDKTLAPVTWQSGADLSEIAGKTVRLRFALRRGSLYAFWVSRDASGRSDGYVAGGGPGYTGNIDTIGAHP